MELYFVRHAPAAERPEDGSDNPNRALTPEGRERMQQAARGLARFVAPPDLLLASPYLRASQTAEILGKHLALPIIQAGELQPGFMAEQLGPLLEQHGRLERVMLVGHEPDLSTVACWLTGARVLWFKKGAACRIDCAHVGAACGELRWFLPPKVLRLLGA